MKWLLARFLLAQQPLIAILCKQLTKASCRATLRGHHGCVYSARFNTAGDKIVTASYDKTLKIWDVPGLLAAFDWFETKCSLEHALLVHCIYKSHITGLLSKKKLGMETDSRFDFNMFPHLQIYFETMPALVQKYLAPFVKLKMMSDTSK